MNSSHNLPVKLKVAVGIPCYNEGLTITQTLQECKLSLPDADLYVFDNDSSDDTAELARLAGATVISVKRRGKGNVVRRIFADIDADVYVMVDGDATYDTTELNKHVRKLLDERLDMIVGCREDNRSDERVYRSGHRIGNRMLTHTVSMLFGRQFTDMLSGYRVFSKRFAKTYPGVAHGFEVETELTVHALELRMPIAEVPVSYRSRPEGSVSKLSTYQDGLRILKAITRLVMHERPLQFFTTIALVLSLVGGVMALPVASTFFETGLVPRFPTLMLILGILLSAVSSMICGIIVNAITVSRQEMKLLSYLSISIFQRG